MQWLTVLFVLISVLVCASIARSDESPRALDADNFKCYIDEFNANDRELYPQYITNAASWRWMCENIPFFECPDEDLTRTYYFRWWTFRKHIEKTPDGYVITEFLPKVSWAGKYNTISCAAGHHFYEGRWIHNPIYLDDYALFWFRKGGEPRLYSFWATNAIYARYLVTGDKDLILELLPDLVNNYKAWESDHLDESGLFWQIDDRDGMEVSIAGSGCRATINSYMYGDAIAISNIAKLAGKDDLAREYAEKAKRIKHLVETRLWDDKSEFFKVLPRGEGAKLADVRELHGYTPWYFELPDQEFSPAWKQIKDPAGFYAPYGLTTAEQRDARFALSYQGHECQWNGPSWPYSTSVTLTAMANLLQDYKQDVVTKSDYLDLLKIYARSQQLKLDDGRVVPWIDENLNSLTGDWISRTRLKSWKNGNWDPGKGGEERGKDYNHSTFCDLIISGLVGLKPQPNNELVVKPLIPDNTWDYFCLDNVLYHGHILTILYDKTGNK